ncbi:hypothetical protein A3Q56_03670 [Intoshia linei]|uniref:phosphoenolpyruvate carboxykinase (GTP) n=1 Tax=Intoshia linei TaxID=1819745 RepID=A0A177B2E3_9BILA|nr:hypothetical protein A3Q56_03670 [Intoshia linei]
MTKVASETTTLPKIIYGKSDVLPQSVIKFVEKYCDVCTPHNLHFCDGSQKEYDMLTQKLVLNGTIKPLKKYDNCWLARTDPRDVARVESKTVISSSNKRDTVPLISHGNLGNWISTSALEIEKNKRFPGCMNGRTMYIIPFVMGPLGGPLSKIAIQLTDSAYVVMSMRTMTRMNPEVYNYINKGDSFVKCVHSVGVPNPSSKNNSITWPCNPELTMVAHEPEKNTIMSFGSGYGGNSLLGKKCLALRLGSIMGKKESWLAEHMLILGITCPNGKKRYVAAAFPSACGKTNLAMMSATLPGYKIECIGDDIAWMKYNKAGELRAINPEYGFFGVAPGTSDKTNINAMKTINRNTIFTNVAETEDGDFYWEGLPLPKSKITSWLGKEWNPNSSNTPAAHPNSRFCVPAKQCPNIDDRWNDPNGVPIDAIIFGGRRSSHVPLIYESFDWNHGVFIGASMRSEATAAAEHTAKVLMNDPFAMRPFFGYNFGDYLQHWLNMGDKSKDSNSNRIVPKIFHVNWFRKCEKTGKFLWPGFGENCRVLDWIIRRLDDKDNKLCNASPIGYLPKFNTFNLSNLTNIDMEQLFSLSKEAWLKETDAINAYLKNSVGEDVPSEITKQLLELRSRLIK